MRRFVVERIESEHVAEKYNATRYTMPKDLIDLCDEINKTGITENIQLMIRGVPYDITLNAFPVQNKSFMGERIVLEFPLLNDSGTITHFQYKTMERRAENTKNCDKCVFGMYYGYDKEGLPTIQQCHAKEGVTDEQAAEMIKSKIFCEYYEKGHELYKRYKKGEFDDLSASERYIIDKMRFSETPTAICTSFNENCWRGENGYCYCRLSCNSKSGLSERDKKTVAERKILDKIVDTAKEPAKKKKQKNHRTYEDYQKEYDLLSYMHGFSWAYIQQSENLALKENQKDMNDLYQKYVSRLQKKCLKNTGKELSNK